MGSSQGAAVALGKFDAMHTGHRALAAEAQKLGGHPWLLSFSGMANVLGWPERQPLVAVSDRPRVLTSWAPYCGGVVPLQRYIPFAAVRQLSPNDFVKVLALNLKVSGVVVGKGFRFGYKASGDTEALQTLGAQYGLKVSVVDLVQGDAKHGIEKVSSSSVRSALADGQMERVRNLLGRPHRLVIQPTGNTKILQAKRWNFQKEDFKNQPPKDGKYVAHVSMMLSQGGSLQLPFPVEIEIDSSGILIHSNTAAVGDPPASTAEVLIDF
ncbi:probable bifunctional riboflavin kinase/FMN adenylyltransferase [Coccomyxa sp. Obi]|nr:probable bifunctional riboflavin kinase/FMN adenylyltransferase [Coccomyxa sp. Obi]